MKIRSRWRQTAGYVMARGLLALSDRIAVRQASACGRWAGRCYYTLNPTRRDIAIQNLLRTQVAASREEAAQIARRSFEHFGMFTVETIKMAPDLQLDEPGGQVIDALHPETRALLDSHDEGAIFVQQRHKVAGVMPNENYWKGDC